MKKTVWKKIAALFTSFLLAVSPLGSIYAEDYTAQTMRLLRYEGEVEILDASGKSRFVMENVRFKSGEAVRTGESSLASVSMDATKIVTMDQQSVAEFVKQGSHLLLTLKEGTILLDVQAKLDENESLDVQTSTMTVGIRGTCLGMSEKTEEGMRVSRLSVLEGVTQVTYIDGSGVRQSFQLPSGYTAVAKDQDGNGWVDVPPEIRKTIKEDTEGFIDTQIQREPQLRMRVEEAGGAPSIMDMKNIGGSSDSNRTSSRSSGGGSSGAVSISSLSLYPADGDWQWTDDIYLVAQSASKIYDGTPLIRASGVLVEGLPADFRCVVSAVGSQTDAGKSANPIGGYKIYNAQNEDVTSHFVSVNKEEGTLIVEPLPITVITGSAEKTYDGLPLTESEAEIIIQSDDGQAEAPLNVSYLADPTLKNQTLYGVCGAVTVHGTNPLTGETCEIQLFAGYKLTIFLNSEEGRESLEFITEMLSVDEIPEEILRIYADNPEAMRQACREAGWNDEAVSERIASLSDSTEEKLVNEDSVQIAENEAERLLSGFVDVHISIDSSITNYNGRALGGQEAEFVPVPVDSGISVSATGSRTYVGISENTFEIDWGTARQENYAVTAKMGTLTVYGAEAVVSTGSSEKVYDGQPLTNSQAVITGLKNGETAQVTGTGTITQVGSTENTYTIEWGSADAYNYVLREEPGTLTVEPLQLQADLGGGTEIYNGKLDIPNATITYLNGSHAGESVMGRRARSSSALFSFSLFTGEQIQLEISAEKLDRGVYVLTGTPSFPEGSEDCYSLTFTDTIMTVQPRELIITTSSASKAYDGTPLTSGNVTVEGLADGETILVTATGSQTEIGSSANTYSIDWGITNKDNYQITEELGTLEVTANSGAIVFTAPTTEKTYDGTALTAGAVTAEGIPTGFTFTATAEGSQMDAGSSDSTVTGYTIYKGTTDVTASFTNIQTVKGTLTVNKKPVTVSTGSASKEYDGTALTNATASITGLVTGETATVTAAGSQTAVGSSSNGYSIAWGETNADNYTVEESLGTLEVTNHTSEVKLTAPSDSQTYNGAPLTAPTDAPASEGLPVGFTVTASYSGSRTDAGTGASQIEEYQIINGNGEDVAGWFTNVTKVNGVLTVNPKEATVTTGSASKAYDGTALTKAEASITGLAAVDEDKVTIAATGSQTEIGFSSNTYSISWGTVNADNYAITEDLGTLTVTGAETVIVDASATKTFDGTPLTADSGTLAVTGLPEGFTVEAEVSGSQKSAGSSDVTFISCRIRKAGEDVTGLFTVETKGTLTVDKFPVVISTESITKEYDGEALTGGAVTINGEEPTWVESSYFFELPGGAWIEYSPLDYGPAEVGDGPVINSGGYEIYGEEEEYDYENDYQIITEYGTLQITPRIVTLMLDGLKDDIVYDGEFHGEGLEVDAGKYGAGSDYAGSSIAVALTACGDGQWQVEMPWEDMIDVSISDGGCDADTYTLACEWEVSFGASDNYSISAVGQEMTIHPRPVIIEGDDYEKPYDGEAFVRAADMEWPVEGEMIYGHITSDQIYPGEGSLYFAIDEYPEYTNPANYVITVTGSLTVTKNFTPITITAPSDEQYYNGAPLLEPTDAPRVEGLPDGYWAEATKEEGKERTNVGSTPIGVTDYTIYNSDNADVTECFGNVTKVPGSLKVKPTKIVLETSYDMYSGDGTNVYGLNSVDAYIDEGPWWYTVSAEKNDDFTWTITVVNLDESFTLTAAVIAEYNEMGDDYEYSLDSDLSGDCLSNYVVSIEDQGAFGLVSGFGSGVAFRAGPNQQEQPRLSRPAALLRAAGRDEQQKTTVLYRSRYVSISPKA